MEGLAQMPGQLERATSDAELRACCDQVAGAVVAMLDAGAPVSAIGRAVALAHDALLVRLLALAEAALGPPPCPYAWLVLGSEGRCEQTLRTDQDNALVYAADAPPAAERYFAGLAEQVVGRLVACGFPRCPGEIMATNPQWRQPLPVWQGYFQRWIMTPDEQALLRVAIFFDYRQVYGALAAEPALRAIVQRARDEHVFLAQLAHAALRQPAPVGLLGRLTPERHDGQAVIDLKLRGAALVVDLARLFALQAGLPDTGTLDRLRAAAATGGLSQAGARDLAAAFERINLLRLRQQCGQLQRGEPPSNLVPLAALEPAERRELRDALRLIRAMQRSVAFAFQTAWFE